jgi:broad specificity phosphatase PhoE
MKLHHGRRTWLLGGTLVALATGWLAGAAPAPAPSEPGKGVRTILLVRHGAYDEGDSRDAMVGKALTEVGRQQASLTGKRFAALPHKVDEVYASPMTRARETAEIACKEFAPLQPVLDPDLAECGPPVTEPASPKPATAAAKDCGERLEKVYARYFKPSPKRDTTVAIFCHGNVIRYLWCKSFGVDPGLWNRIKVSNCNVTEIRVQPDGTMLPVSYNDTGHLPPALQTFSWRRQMYQP